MKIILESKFEVGDRVSAWHGQSFTIVDIEFKKDRDGNGKIFYLSEDCNRERRWFSEDVLKKGDTIETQTGKTIRTKGN